MSTPDSPKKRGRGRPATGHDPVMGLRTPPALRQAIESWCERQEDSPSLAEGVRRLLQLALASEGDKAVPLKKTRKRRS